MERLRSVLPTLRTEREGWGTPGDVVSTSGRSPNHATVTGLSPTQASGLLTPTVPNPARAKPEPKDKPND